MNSAISPACAFAYRPFGSRRSHSSSEVATYTRTNGACSSVRARAFWRASSYGEIAETITAAPARASREATQPIRSMFVSRSSFEKPSPFVRCVADDVAVEPVDEHAALLEVGGDETGDRGLAGGGQPCEPEDETVALSLREMAASHQPPPFRWPARPRRRAGWDAGRTPSSPSPAQRPSRPAPGLVQCVQPIEA